MLSVINTVEEYERSLFSRNKVTRSWSYQRQFRIFSKTISSRSIKENWNEYKLINALESGETILNDLLRASDESGDSEKMWTHREIYSLFQEANKDLCLDRMHIQGIADEYLSKPEIQSNNFDYIICDMLIYAELNEFSRAAFRTNFGTTRESLAFSLANKSKTKYELLKLIFGAISFVLNLAIPVMIFMSESNWSSLGAIWLVIILLANLYLIPKHWLQRRKYKNLLLQMSDTYSLFRDTTISPRVLRVHLDQAIKIGVVFDPQIFIIADRAYAREPTAFIAGF